MVYLLSGEQTTRIPTFYERATFEDISPYIANLQQMYPGGLPTSVGTIPWNYVQGIMSGQRWQGIPITSEQLANEIRTIIQRDVRAGAFGGGTAGGGATGVYGTIPGAGAGVGAGAGAGDLNRLYDLARLRMLASTRVAERRAAEDYARRNLLQSGLLSRELRETRRGMGLGLAELEARRARDLFEAQERERDRQLRLRLAELGGGGMSIRISRGEETPTPTTGFGFPTMSYTQPQAQYMPPATLPPSQILMYGLQPTRYGT